MAKEQAGPPKPPPGFTWLYNRLSIPYEAMFDLKQYIFEPHEERLVPDDVALFLHNGSVIKVDLTTSRGVRALVPSTQEDGKPHPDFRLPYGDPLGDEVIDRSMGDNPLGLPSQIAGTKTHAVKMPVGTKPPK